VGEEEVENALERGGEKSRRAPTKRRNEDRDHIQTGESDGLRFAERKGSRCLFFLGLQKRRGGDERR